MSCKPPSVSQAIREVLALDPSTDAQETILALQSIEPVWDELFPPSRPGKFNYWWKE